MKTQDIKKYSKNSKKLKKLKHSNNYQSIKTKKS